MIELIIQSNPRVRIVGLMGVLVVLVQWWGVNLWTEAWTEKWLWSLDPSRGFPPFFRVIFPMLLLFIPFQRLLEPFFRLLARDPSRVFNVLLVTVVGGALFWTFRIRVLSLGDAKLIMDYFVALTTYASVREPLESVLHTDFSRFLFHNWGIHPKTSFQMMSCLWGCVALLIVGARLSSWGRGKESYLSWIWLLFLVGPIHLFFGYIEWYTQFTVGLILFEVFGVSQVLTGRGLWMALVGLMFASCSHLVGFGFVPAGFLLILMTLHRRHRKEVLVIFALVLGVAVALAMLWVRRHIVFDHSVKATARLFGTLLPLMRADDPDNPPGSWQYPWLSGNHLADLLNEIILCGLFPLLILAGCCPLCELLRQTGKALRGPKGLLIGAAEIQAAQGTGESPTLTTAIRRDRLSWRLILFFLPQLLVGGAFLLLWNPWLGFPGDWDLFSFFAWPLLAVGLVGVVAWCPAGDQRRRLLWLSGLPAFSVVAAWIFFHHQGSPPTFAEVRAVLKDNLADLRLEEAQTAVRGGDWPAAFLKAEEAMTADPASVTRCLEIVNLDVVQRMADEWPKEKQVTRMACDMEIVSASPFRRLLVMDTWGRVFLFEGGFLNDWSADGIPGIPEHHAVAMEIVPWKAAAVILRDDGAMYEIPISSWVDPDPPTPRKTWFVEAPEDRSPRPIGNFFTDYARARPHPGRRAVDLAVDHANRRLVVLDTTGNLSVSGPGKGFNVKEKAAFIGIDAELNREGSAAFIGDYFGGLHAWPGGSSPLGTTVSFNWPAIADFEPARGAADMYILDVQGGVFAFSSSGTPLIDPARMQHYSPGGQPEKITPYHPYPSPFFCDLEIVPGERAYYRMNWNFRIYYAVQKEN